MRKEVIRDAIVRANKLGLNGVRVVDYIEPEGAAEDDRLRLVTTQIEAGVAADSTDDTL